MPRRRFGFGAAARVGLIGIALHALPAPAADDYAARRAALLQEIAADVRATSLELNKTALDERVLRALNDVPRHEFVPKSLRGAAYENRPLPIGHGQTISQPYIVAIMTDLLALPPGARVLEVGTGSGYQAAVLARLAARVYSIEIIDALGRKAQQTLRELRYDNVQVRVGDGYYGWEEAAPFDGILVTAAASHVPPPLIKQLKRGGRMLIPVGSRFMVQHLLLVHKDQNDNVTTRQVLPVQFVPLTGGHD
jgi:protein-L-isoaspartate(D-aspartate) O-methyltransferase